MDIHITPQAAAAAAAASRGGAGTSAGGGLPRSVAGQIGLDPSAPGMDKAAQYWDMLDDLHKSDPAAYQDLINEQLHEGRAKRRTRQFFPTPGFVVKTFCINPTDGGGRRKMFINITGFDGVEPPTSGNGKVLDDAARGYQARSIPLLVSPLRDAPTGRAGGSETAVCVDVVFNPWVTRKCDQEGSFKQQVIRLAMRWVQDEHSPLVVSVPDARVINSVYKGGKGASLREPVAFPITLSEEEMKDLYPEGQPRSTAAATAAQQQQQQQQQTKSAMLQTPSDLLRAFKVGSSADEAEAPGAAAAGAGAGASSDQPSGGGGGVLDGLFNLNPRPGPQQQQQPVLPSQQRHAGIREVASSAGPGNSGLSQSSSSSSSSSLSGRHPGIREVVPAGQQQQAGTEKKSKKGAVKKGFLWKKKGGKAAAPLYPEGSNEHKPQNPYPWANVIDLGGSDQEKLQRQMEQYARTGEVDEPTFKAKKPEPKRPAEWDPRFQEEQRAIAQAEEAAAQAAAQRRREKEARAALSAEEEAQLDKLMAAADAGFGKLGVGAEAESAAEGAEFYESLKGAMALMGGGGGAGAAGSAADDMFGDPETMSQFAEMTKHIMATQDAGTAPSQAAANDAAALGEKVKGWASRPGAAAPAAAAAPAFRLATTTDKKGAPCEQVVISLPDVAAMGDIDLQLSDSELKLTAKTTLPGSARQRLRVAFTTNVDSGACKAKFKKGKLTVTVKHRQ